MTQHLTEADLIEAVAPLTRDRLLHYVHLHVVRPVQTAEGPRYREIDLRRITLLCELADDMEMHEDALVVVMHLLDQLHGSRGRLDAMMRALAQEDPEVRARIARRLAGGATAS
jgi:chaperone modulatory protein CbpM